MKKIDAGLAAVLRAERLEAENDRLRGIIEDACKVFDYYNLPGRADHYRSALSSQDRGDG